MTETVLDPRQVAVELVARVEQDRSFLEPLLADRLARLPAARDEDRGLLTELAHGTLRLRNRMDWIINLLYRGEPSSIDPRLRAVLQVALYQLFCMDRVPSYAAVNEAVNQTKRLFPGRGGLVNGILRSALRKKGDFSFPDFSDDPEGNLTWYHSHPAWLVKRWISQYGANEARDLCEANNHRPPLTVRVNLLQADRDEAMKMLEGEGIRSQPTRWSPGGLILDRSAPPASRAAFMDGGLIQAQDEASQLVSFIVHPRPGERVLDLCSGAGIKAAHMAALMKNEGSIIAMDVNERKLKAARDRCRAMGASIIDHRHGDALELTGAEFPHRFDRILLDAPCSGLGTVRRKPEMKWFAREEDSSRLAVLQGRMLQSCAGLLKTGGTLVYVTCTMLAEENEQVIEEFLRYNPAFELHRPGPPIEDSMIDGNGFFRTAPHVHDTDGFFAALLVKGS